MTSTTSHSASAAAVEPAGPWAPSIVPLVGDEPAMRDCAAKLVERARCEGVELTGDNGLLTALVRQVLQTGLEVEMTDHLGYPPHAVEGRLPSMASASWTRRRSGSWQRRRDARLVRRSRRVRTACLFNLVCIT